MEPQIRFCASADGTRIAYTIYGVGPPLLCAWSPTMSMDAKFSLPEPRAYLDALAARTTLVTFDRRGTGASSRDVDDLSLEAQACDITAVANGAGFDSFTLFGHGNSLAECVHYVIHQGARIERLILWTNYFVGANYNDVARSYREDWSYARRRLAGETYPNGPVSLQRAYGQAVKETLSAEMAARYLEAISAVDFEVLLSQVAASTLVLQRDGVSTRRPGAMHVAALIPNSQLRFVAGQAASAFPGHQPVVEAVAEFMGLAEDAPVRAGVMTILFTDLVGHTEMMQRLGDDKGRDVLREHERITRETLKEYAGAEVKTMGDGFMASFGSVTKAMDCAIALQRAFATHTESMPEPLHVRVGLNAGEPIEEDGDLFGSTVILASRIAAQAGAGEILIPEPLRHLLSGKSYVYADRGETALKGFEDAVRLYEVRWRE